MSERTVFLAALEKGDPAERAAFLDEACSGDVALRARVEALLKSHDEAGSFLDTPALQRAAEQLEQGSGGATHGEPPDSDTSENDLDFLAPSQKPGALGRLGHYDVLEVIGRGGMGIVLKAFDEKLHRVVAIKVMARQLAGGASARKRFIREAQAAAAVRDEHVIAIYAVEDAPSPYPLPQGGEGGGLPYLVMEYIGGKSLQERLDESGPLELKELLRIGHQAACGLAAAHAQGLIHRDIKPANILLENGVERVKITDFGLARAADDASSITQSGVVAGTPQYMSPEQARAEPLDHRSDLFSLGSVLYAMCTGRAPFRAGSTVAILRRVCEDMTRPIREINPDIPDWLVAIIDKLHAKEPADRYQTATEVAEVLGGRLAQLQQPISGVAGAEALRSPGEAPSRVAAPAGASKTQPRPPTAVGVPLLAGKQWHTRRWVAAAAILLIAIAGLGFTEAVGVTKITDFVATTLRISTPEGTLIVEVDDPNVKVTIEGDGGLVITGAGPQEVRLRPGNYRVQADKDGRPIKTEIVTITRGDKKIVAVKIERPTGTPAPPPVPSATALRVFTGHAHQVDCVDFAPDGRRAISGGWDKTIRLWDVETGKELRCIQAEGTITGLAFAPDGRHALAGVPSGAIVLWDLESGEEVRRFKTHANAVSPCVAFSPDGRRALSGAYDRVVRLWDVDTGQEVRQFTKGYTVIRCVAISPDGRRALSGSDDFTVRLWDVETGAELHCLRGHACVIRSVAFSPDGRRALSTSGGLSQDGKYVEGPDRSVRLWDLETGQELRRFEGGEWVRAATFTPDGRYVLAGFGMDRGPGRELACTLRLWEADTGKEVCRFEGHTEGTGIGSVAISPDGRYALSGSSDRTVRLWPLPPSPLDQLDPAKIPPEERFAWQPQELVAVLGEHRGKHGGQIQCLALSPDGKWLASGGWYSDIVLWDPETLRERGRIKGPHGSMTSLAFAADSRRLVSLDNDGRGIRLWELETGQELRRIEAEGTALCNVAISPDGRWAITGHWDKLVRVWDLETGAQLLACEGHAESVTSVAVSRDGRLAVSGSRDGTILLWDPRTGKELRRFEGCSAGIAALVFAPDGSRILSGDTLRFKDGKYQQLLDYGLRLWDVDSGQEIRRFQGHTQPVRSVAFSPDGRQALSGEESEAGNSLCLWDVESGRKLAGSKGQVAYVYSVGFFPDGRRAFSGGGDGAVRLWDTKTLQELIVPSCKGHPSRVLALAFSPDGRFLLSGGIWDKYPRLWDLTTGADLRRFEGIPPMRYCESVAWLPDGRQVLFGDSAVLRLGEVGTGKELRRFETYGYHTVTPDGRRVLSRDKNSLFLWELQSGKVTARFEGHTAAVMSMAVSPDGRRVLSGSKDKTVRLWDSDSGRELLRFGGVTGEVRSVAFAPNGRWVAAGEGTSVRLWDVAQPERPVFSRPHGMSRVTFAPDGKTLASAGTNGRITLWDVPAGYQVHEWQLPGEVSGLAFAPDGRHLATANGNGTIYILRLATTGADPDRTAAEWVLQRGGRVQVGSVWITQLAELPPRRFQLSGINLANTPLTDAELERLKGLKNLGNLDLNMTPVSDAGLEHLKELSGLQNLSLSQTAITDAGLAHLKGMTGLQSLFVSDTAITDAGLRHLQALRGLRYLGLENTAVTDAGLEHLKGLTSLQGLYLRGTRITDAGLEKLKGLTGLFVLFLNDTEISGAGLEHLQALKALDQLSLENTATTDTGLRHLQALPRLRLLVLTNTAVTDAGLEHLKGMTQLQFLYLGRTRISDAGLEKLKGLTGLLDLYLDDTSISDAGLEHLKGLTQLRKLSVKGTRVSEAGVRQFKEALPKCTISR